MRSRSVQRGPIIKRLFAHCVSLIAEGARRRMSYVPTTDAERREMLDAIGVAEFDALVQAVPADLRFPGLRLPSALSEMEVLRTLGALADRNADATRYPTFIGAGAYNHFIP